MLLAGPAGIGKTFMMLEMADNLSRGEMLFGHFPVPVPVRTLLIEQEVGIYGTQERLRSKYSGEKRPPDNAWIITKNPDITIDDPAGFERLSGVVREVDPGVLILDPITRFMVVGDESDNAAVSRVFRALDRLLVERPEMSIVLTHHFGKDPADPADAWDDLDIDRVRGASKWRDVPDLRVMVRVEEWTAGRPKRWRTSWVPRHAARFNLALELRNDFSITHVEGDVGGFGTPYDEPRKK